MLDLGNKREEILEYLKEHLLRYSNNTERFLKYNQLEEAYESKHKKIMSNYIYLALRDCETAEDIFLKMEEICSKFEHHLGRALILTDYAEVTSLNFNYRYALEVNKKIKGMFGIYGEKVNSEL
ncbi:MAG: hypothetical protein ACRC0A_01685 [Chitinophagaceae bacterium]